MKKIYIISSKPFLAEVLSSLPKFKSFRFCSFETFELGGDLYINDDTFKILETPVYMLTYNLPIKLINLANDIEKFFNQPFINFGNSILDFHKRILTFQNYKITLTEIECNILKLLSEGKVQSKKDLEFKILGYNKEVQSNSLENHIYRLRQKIKEFSDHELILTTKNGYKISE